MNYDLHEVGDGVWAAIVDDETPAVGNAAIVDLGDETLVFDTTMSFQLAKRLRDEAQELTGRDPGILVNSHWHGDHILGNQSFTGKRIVSSGRTKELIETRAAERLEQNKQRYEEEAPELRAIVLTPPTETFENRLGLGRAELLTYGGGHTESDAFLWIPGSATLLAADLVVIDNHAWVGDGDVPTWRRILKELEELDPEVVVPGHGPVGTGDDIALMDAYLAELLRLEPGTPMPPEFTDLGHPDIFGRNLEALRAR
jgi:glyoxylase-like metal-dependent hydrolase (beta-lactamase superfamily II)